MHRIPPICTSTPGNSLKLTFTSGATVFYIDEKAQMPQIQIACELTSPPPALSATAAQPVYQWTVTLQLHPAGVPFAAGRTTTHPPIKQTQSGATFTIPFAAVRGGTLTVTASAMIAGKLSMDQ